MRTTAVTIVSVSEHGVIKIKFSQTSVICTQVKLLTVVNAYFHVLLYKYIYLS